MPSAHTHTLSYSTVRAEILIEISQTWQEVHACEENDISLTLERFLHSSFIATCDESSSKETTNLFQ